MHKQGDIRQDGKVFWGRKANWEYWVTPEAYAKKKDQIRRWRQSNPDRVKSQIKNWYSNNKDRKKENERKRNAVNPRENADRCRLWKKANPHKVCSLVAKRRQLKRCQTPADITTEEKAAIVSLYQARERISKCLGVLFHVDHIVPIARGGGHTLSNLQLLPATLNLRKGDRMLIAA